MTNLVRTIRLRDLLYLFVGSVIGSGIFIAPGLILRQVHGSVALSLLVWIVGGGLSLLGALTYAEWAAANPEAGGSIVYPRWIWRATGVPVRLVPVRRDRKRNHRALARAFTKYLNEIVQLGEWQSNAISIGMFCWSLLSTSGHTPERQFAEHHDSDQSRVGGSTQRGAVFCGSSWPRAWRGD